MANDYYNSSGWPATSASGTSSPARAELTNITAGFAKLPTLTSNGSKAVVVNSGGTALTVTTGTLALAGNLATTGAFNTTFAQGATVTLTLPTANGTLATLAGTEALTNKTVNKVTITAPATSATLTIADGASLITAGAYAVTLTATGTTGLTLPTTGTLATLAGTEVFSGKTLTAPVLNGALSGDALALQAEMQTGTATDSIVSPGRQHFHPSAAKFFVSADAAGDIGQSFNVASITDAGVGILSITINADFSNTEYVVGGHARFDSAATDATAFIMQTMNSGFAAGALQVRCSRASDGANVDPARFMAVGYGDQV